MSFKSFPPARPLPGLKKDFPKVSARVNSFGERKVVSNVPLPTITQKSGNSSASDRLARPARKQEPQQLAKKVTVNSLPHTTTPVPFRARPVPASTYKATFVPTLRRTNDGRKEQEHVALKSASSRTPPVIVDDPTVDDNFADPVKEPVNFDEATVCRSDESPIASMDESTETNITIASASASLADTRPIHPQGPGIPPFLPRVYLIDNITSRAPQRFDQQENHVPVFDTTCDEYGTFNFNATIDSYRCVFMTPDGFEQFRKDLVESQTHEQIDIQDDEQQEFTIPDEPVISAHLPDDSVPVNDDSVSAVPIPDIRKKKPRNACYKRRQVKRAKAWAERNGVEFSMEAFESYVPQKS